MRVLPWDVPESGSGCGELCETVPACGCCVSGTGTLPDWPAATGTIKFPLPDVADAGCCCAAVRFGMDLAVRVRTEPTVMGVVLIVAAPPPIGTTRVAMNAVFLFCAGWEISLSTSVDFWLPLSSTMWSDSISVIVYPSYVSPIFKIEV